MGKKRQRKEAIPAGGLDPEAAAALAEDDEAAKELAAVREIMREQQQLRGGADDDDEEDEEDEDDDGGAGGRQKPKPREFINNQVRSACVGARAQGACWRLRGVTRGPTTLPLTCGAHRLTHSRPSPLSFCLNDRAERAAAGAGGDPGGQRPAALARDDGGVRLPAGAGGRARRHPARGA